MARRRLIRPRDNASPPRANREGVLQKLRGRLQQERTALARWQKRLKRASTPSPDSRKASPASNGN